MNSKLRDFFDVKARLTVAAAVAFIAGDWLIATHQSLGWVCLCCLAGWLLGYAQGRMRAGWILAVLPLIGAFYFSVRCPKHVAFGSSTRCVEGTISSFESHNKCVDFALALTQPVNGVDRLLVRVPTEAMASVTDGDYVRVSGLIVAPKVPDWPFEFNESMFVERHGTQAILRCLSHHIIVLRHAKPDLLRTVSLELERLRSRINSCHEQALGTKYGALLSSMVIGDKAVDLSSQTTAAFMNDGLSHILAASGFNLTIVCVSVYFLLRLFTKKVLLVNSLVAACVTLFVGLAGCSPSVERAAIMCFVTLLARSVYRTPYLPATLCAALVVTLIIDPKAILDIGLQLSYSATLGIACASTPIIEFIKSKLSGLPVWLIDAVAVAAVAQLSVLPVQLYYFWQLGLLSLLANIVVAPLVPVITLLGFVSSTLAAVGWAPLTDLALDIDWLVCYPLLLLDCAVNWFAAVPWARLPTGPPFLLAIILYYCSLSLLVIFLSSAHWRTLAALCVLTFAGLFWRAPLPPLTVICQPDMMIAIKADGKALVAGGTAERARRILDFFGAQPVASLDNATMLTDFGGLTLKADNVPPVAVRKNMLFLGSDDRSIRMHYRCLVVTFKQELGWQRIYHN